MNNYLDLQNRLKGTQSEQTFFFQLYKRVSICKLLFSTNKMPTPLTINTAVVDIRRPVGSKKIRCTEHA